MYLLYPMESWLCVMFSSVFSRMRAGGMAFWAVCKWVSVSDDQKRSGLRYHLLNTRNHCFTTSVMYLIELLLMLLIDLIKSLALKNLIRFYSPRQARVFISVQIPSAFHWHFTARHTVSSLFGVRSHTKTNDVPTIAPSFTLFTTKYKKPSRLA